MFRIHIRRQKNLEAFPAMNHNQAMEEREVRRGKAQMVTRGDAGGDWRRREYDLNSNFDFKSSEDLVDSDSAGSLDTRTLRVGRRGDKVGGSNRNNTQKGVDRSLSMGWAKTQDNKRRRAIGQYQNGLSGIGPKLKARGEFCKPIIKERERYVEPNINSKFKHIRSDVPKREAGRAWLDDHRSLREIE